MSSLDGGWVLKTVEPNREGGRSALFCTPLYLFMFSLVEIRMINSVYS